MLNSVIFLNHRFTPAIQKIAANFFWLTSARILQMGVSLIVGIFVARYLGPENYGAYNYAIAFVAIVSSLTSTGLRGIIVREIVQNRAYKDEILGTVFVLRVFSDILAIAITIGAIALIKQNDPAAISLVAVISLRTIWRSIDVIESWFQAETKSKYIAYVETAILLISSIIKIGLVLLQAPLVAFAWILFIEAGLTGIGLIVAYRSNNNSLRNWRFNSTRAKALLNESWYLILSGIGAIVYLKVDQLMIGEMLGKHEVGIYAAAAKISEMWYFIPAFIALSIFPTLIQIKQKDEHLYQIRLQQSYDFVCGLAVLIAITVSLLSSQIITILYGQSYTGAEVVLSIHIWAAVFIFLGEILSKWLINEKLLFFSLIRTSSGAIINIALNLILIPLYGIKGSAIATLIAYAATSYLACFLHPETRVAGRMMTLSLLMPFRLIKNLVRL